MASVISVNNRRTSYVIGYISLVFELILFSQLLDQMFYDNVIISKLFLSTSRNFVVFILLNFFNSV